MADDALDFLPLFPNETEAAILARMRAWANEGLDPAVDVDEWVDTREGSHWYVSVMPSVREMARLWDSLGTEFVAAAFPVWAWADYLDDHAEVQDIVRLAATYAGGEATFEGPQGTVIAGGTTIGVEPVDPDQEVPEFEVTAGGVIPAPVLPATMGVLTLPIRATEAGVFGNVSATAVTEFSTPPPLDVSVSNALPTTGGTEAETDEALRERVLGAFQGQGAGNKRDYERWGRAWAGVGRVTVIPLWNGAGTVKVIATTAEGDPVSAETIAGLQADLDPVSGQGEGRAPISAIVTVGTAAVRLIEITTQVECEVGYSLDGFGGTVAVGDRIVAALREYVERIEPGGEIVVSQLLGCVAGVIGVHDARVTHLEGVTPAVNVRIDDDPAEVPSLGTVTMTAAVL